MATLEIHPSELGYAFSYAQTEQIIGWGIKPFLPEGTDAAAAWFEGGEARLAALGRLTGSKDTGYRFSDDMGAAILALVNPELVMTAERKVAGGVRRMTVHSVGDTFIGLNQRGADAMFEMTRYANLSAAAAACAAFVGAAIDAFETDVRVDTRKEFLTKLHTFTQNGKTKAAAQALMKLGMSPESAASATKALAEPRAAGLLTVFYCAQNTVQRADPFTVMTSVDQHSWVIFPPASLDAPMTLERSSVSALAARISVGVIARMSVAA